ncbi:MAG: OmpA family protein [Syntrophales bacterium]|jgi:outer membrane protein OmpA-like peptidoglycan-associated protein|nr:OmpA family protein [Syntrophales bacterium]
MNYSSITSQLKAAVLAITVGAVLAGCAAVDPSEQIAKDRLEQARTAYAQAKANPIVESYSLKTLLEAEKTLQAAEQVRQKVYFSNPPKPYDSWEKKFMFDDIARLAYMAERKSQTSVALAEGVVTRSEIVKLGREKAEVQLLKSQMQQKLLQQDLDEKASALNLAKQQLASATSEAERAIILADIQAKEAALANAQANAKDREAEMARVEAESQAREAEMARAEAADQARAAEMARAEAESQAREAEKARAELAGLMKELSELQGQLTDRGIVLTIGDVLFAFDKAVLNASAQNSMDKIAAFLREKQNRNLLVEGHTDSVGSEEYNQGLSEQRAASVKNALVKRGVAGERIVAIGYSKKYPLASNDTAAGRQQNRRVEAIILNEGVNPESQFRK